MNEFEHNGNKIVEYPEGIFTAYWLDEFEDVHEQSFDTLKEAQDYLDEEGMSLC